MVSFKEQALSGKRPIGAYLALDSPFSAQLMGRAGFDWVLIDMEHAPLSAREMTSMVHGIALGSAGKCSSLVRVPAGGTEWIKWALDSGASGVVVPMVQGRADAEQLVEFARYPPVGERSFGPFQAQWADLSADSDVGKYFSQKAHEVAIVPMIESRAGVEDAEGIISTPGVTAIFIGPVDLRLSMGLSGGHGEEKEYIDALKKIAALGKRQGIPVGIFSTSPEVQKRQIALGFSYFLVTGDAIALSSGAKVAVDSAKEVCRAARL